MTKAHGNKRYYSSIYIDVKKTLETFGYLVNKYNEQFKDADGKTIVGSEIVRPQHIETFRTILNIVVKRVMLKNKQNSLKHEIKPYIVDVPIAWDINVYDIVNVHDNILEKKSSTNKIKAHLRRLRTAGLIDFGATLKYDGKTKKRFADWIQITPQILCIRTEKDGEIIEKSNFLNISKSNISEIETEKNCIYINTNKEKNKKRQSTIVDKRNASQDLQNISEKNRTSEKVEQTKASYSGELTEKLIRRTANIYDLSKEEKKQLRKQLSIGVAKPEKEQNSGGDVNKTLQNNNSLKTNKLQQAKELAILNFWRYFIVQLWFFVKDKYLPETAGLDTIFYVEQAFETLANDKMYFGACKTEEHIKYQYDKLISATESTANWYKKMLKKNPNFNFRFVYPNTFLKTPAGKNAFSFKNSILTRERTMKRTEKINMQYEQEMAKHINKFEKRKSFIITASAVYFIYQEQDKERQKELIQKALQHFTENYEMKYLADFKANLTNKYFYPNLLDLKFKPDSQFIDECFFNTAQEKLTNEINKYAERLKNLIDKGLIVNSDIARKYVSIRPDKTGNIHVLPHRYNQKTLDFLKGVA